MDEKGVARIERGWSPTQPGWSAGGAWRVQTHGHLVCNHEVEIQFLVCPNLAM